MLPHFSNKPDSYDIESQLTDIQTLGTIAKNVHKKYTGCNVM